MPDLDEVVARLNSLEESIAELQEKLDGNENVAKRGSRRTEAKTADWNSVIWPNTSNEADKIVGGQETTDFPDCCAVGDDNEFFCTGTLISPNVVVTAKHCTGVSRVFFGPNVAGDGEIINVITEHRSSRADIRLLVLEKNATPKPRRIARGGEVKGPEATLVGFGHVNLGGTVGYGKKRMVQVPITSMDCSQDGDNSFGCAKLFEMVAGHKGLLKDSCRGDSGGPLYIQSETGEYLLLGATSRGINNSNKVCGDGGIYVRLDQFLGWMKQVSGQDF